MSSLRYWSRWGCSAFLWYWNNKKLLFPLCTWKNSANAYLSDPVICVSSVVLCLLCSPSAAEPRNFHVMRRQKTIICLSEKGYRLIPSDSRCIEIKCLSFSQMVTRYQPGCFPRENSWAELSLASERISDVPPAELSTRTARAFTDPGPEGNPREIPTWTLTGWVGKGMEGKSAGVLRGERGRCGSWRGGYEYLLFW